MTIVDTHLHVWTNDYAKYPMEGGKQVKEDGTAEFLIDTMNKAGVDKAVIVQPIHYLFDNSYVSDTMKKHPGKFAGIGLVNHFEPGAPERLEKLVKDHGFSGLRIHLARPPQASDWVRPDQDAIWKKAEQIGSSFIIYGPANLLPAVEPIIARFPKVKVALDHNGGAPRDEESPYPVLKSILALSKYPNVYVKLTPHKHKEPFPYKDTHRIFKAFVETFGAKRLMWGTNFPGVMRETGYTPALELFSKHLEFLTKEDKDWILGKTALGIYNFGGKK